MPRQSRKLSKSKTYHVMIRGNERKPIFIDEEDRFRFIQTLCEKNKKGQYFVYAYCLMDNHVHLLVNEGNDEISRIMKRINVSYAYYFNKKYGRIGHLFQDRFKSESIEDDYYLLAAVRYVHNNPVKAGIASHPSKYKWSSYGLYINNAETKESFPVNIDFILSMFSNEKNKAMELFGEYSRQESDDGFIEYQAGKTDKPIQSENEVRLIISESLKENSLSVEDIKKPINAKLRRNLIIQLKSSTSLSVRQIANILGVDRNIVQRTH